MVLTSPAQISNEAFQLAKVFLGERMKAGASPLYNLKTVRSSRYWSVFISIVEKFGSNPEWNPRNFVKFCLDSYGIKIFPHQMSRHVVWNEYKGSVENMQSREREITTDMLNSYNIIKEWYHKRGEVVETFTAYMEANPLWFIRISPNLISCSRSMLLALTKMKHDDIMIKVKDSAKLVRTLQVYKVLKRLIPKEVV